MPTKKGFRIEVCHHKDTNSCVMLFKGDRAIAHMMESPKLGTRSYIQLYPRDYELSIYTGKRGFTVKDLDVIFPID